jgi:hypothetical protein
VPQPTKLPCTPLITIIVVIINNNISSIIIIEAIYGRSVRIVRSRTQTMEFFFEPFIFNVFINGLCNSNNHRKRVIFAEDLKMFRFVNSL